MTQTLIFIITTAIILAPAFFCGGFYYGFVTAQSVYTQKMVKKENIPFSSLIKGSHAPAETSHQRMARILAENVENYGTNIPQKEVK